MSETATATRKLSKHDILLALHEGVRFVTTSPSVDEYLATLGDNGVGMLNVVVPFDGGRIRMTASIQLTFDAKPEPEPETSQ